MLHPRREEHGEDPERMRKNSYIGEKAGPNLRDNKGKVKKKNMKEGNEQC